MRQFTKGEMMSSVKDTHLLQKRHDRDKFRRGVIVEKVGDSIGEILGLIKLDSHSFVQTLKMGFKTTHGAMLSTLIFNQWNHFI